MMVCPNVVIEPYWIWCMMSLTNLPLFGGGGYALKTITFTLNREPSKSVETTPYELWFGKKPKLLFLNVWGYAAYVDRLRPEKLEPKAENCVFIEYPNKMIGYTFDLRSEGKCVSLGTCPFSRKGFSRKN